MKKRFFGAALLAAAVMSSCSQNDVTEVLPESDNTDLLSINIASEASRANDVTTSSLQTNDQTVKLYYVQATTQDTDGSTEIEDLTLNTFTYSTSTSKWTATSDITWAELGYPTYFYSAHDGDALSLDVDDTDYVADMVGTLEYSVSNTDPTNHKDLVAYAAEITSMPSGGTLSVVHKHVLSKINILAGVGTCDADILYVTLKNMYPTNTLTFEDGGYEWGYDDVAEKATATGDLVDYKYRAFATDADSGDAIIISVEGGSNSASSATSLETTTEVSSVDVSNAMMVIPQTTIEVAENETLVTENTTPTYIEVMACMATSEGTDLLGLTEAQDYDGYADVYMIADADYTASYDGDYTDLTMVAATDKLYAKIGFSLGGMVLDQNCQYLLTLDLGLDNSVGGTLLSSSNFTEDMIEVFIVSKSTGETIDPLPDPGTDVDPDAEETDLAIKVSVSSWSTAEVSLADGDEFEVSYTEAEE